MGSDGEPAGEPELSRLLQEITDLKRSNERLEQAFIAISQILMNQQANSAAGSSHVHTPNDDILKKEFERKLKRGRASILKEKLLAHVASRGSVELPELKFVFVDQMRYTSKASFYRYISDLEREGKLARAEANGSTYLTLAAQPDLTQRT